MCSQQVFKDELYVILARRFLADRIHAYLLRDPDAFPSLVGFDMDIVVENSRSLKKSELLIQDVLEQYGWQVLAYIRRGGVHTLLTGRTNGVPLNDDDFLQIDLHQYLTASAVPYVDLATLFERSVIVDGAHSLCRTDGATVSFLGPTLMGIRPKARYERAFAEAQRTDHERVSDLLRQALGKHGEALLKPSVPVIRLWLRALLNALRRRPITVYKVLYCIITERLSAFLHPAGLMISVSGPDGVGKTTAIKLLSALADRRICVGVRIYHTRPYLIPRLAHFLPRQRREKILNTRAHEPRISYFKSWLRLAVLILDYNFGYWLKIRPRLARGELVIFDRYFLDIKADPRIRGIFVSDRILNHVDSLIPQPDFRVVLAARPQTIVSRKQDLSLIEAEDQLARYLALASVSTNCLVLETDDISPRELSSRIINWFSRPRRRQRRYG
jgi:thymidylate kinase